MSRSGIGEVTVRTLLSVLAACVVSFAAATAAPSGTQTLSPTEIQMGESATLTITSSGSTASEIAPPAVPGLEFNEVGQASRVQSINGVTSVSASATYQIMAQQPGVYTIPAAVPGAQPVVLTVKPGGQGGGTAGAGAPPGAGGTGAGAGANPGSSAGAAPPANASSLPSGPTQFAADGAAFVRLRLAKHSLYVGESIPVDIEVGLRDGLVASLNGPPILNGDAFTLNPLAAKPQSREEIVEGKPFTVLLWHSLLSAVKPGTLSLTLQTPLTVRFRTPRPGWGSGSNPGDPFDDPIFQNFFRGSFFNLTQKEITVSSAPASFDIEPLPSEGRPASFSGAIGHFSVSSELSEQSATAGDPLTLRLRVSGSGNFDRVRDPMLHDVPGWKTYEPSARFKPADEIGFSGEKVFEQPLIATASGALTLPPIEFSYFDPETHRYEETRTAPLTVQIAPPTGSPRVAQAPQSAPAPSTPASAAPGDGLRPDHVETSGGASTLLPPYATPAGLALPGALLVAFGLTAAWIRRGPQARADRRAQRAALDTEPWLRAMERAQTRNDPDEFFAAAREFLKRTLAARWQLSPDRVTLESVGARLGADSELTRVFKLAEEARYARLDPREIDLQLWGGKVRQQPGAEART